MHWLVLPLGASVVLGLLVAGWTAVPHEGHGRVQGPASAAPQASAFAPAMDAAMARMMNDMHRPLAGDPDRDFLAMMIPHHQGAVDMARLVLLHGRDPLTRQLAEGILASQAVEIGAMQRRLEALSSPPRENEYPTLGGTRGEGDRAR